MRDRLKMDIRLIERSKTFALVYNYKDKTHNVSLGKAVGLQRVVAYRIFDDVSYYLKNGSSRPICGEAKYVVEKINTTIRKTFEEDLVNATSNIEEMISEIPSTQELRKIRIRLKELHDLAKAKYYRFGEEDYEEC